MAIMAKPLFEIALYPLNFSLLGGDSSTTIMPLFSRICVKFPIGPLLGRPMVERIYSAAAAELSGNAIFSVGRLHYRTAHWRIGRHRNFRMCDALPYAKDGTLSEKLDELFG